MTDIQIIYDGPIVNRADAIKGNLNRYFTGKPCKNGHVDQRSVKSRNCYTCDAISSRKRRLYAGKDNTSTRLGFAVKCGHLTKKGRMYCSECRIKMYSDRRVKKCLTCGVDMVLSNSQYDKYHTCSNECRGVQTSKRQSGSNSHLWMGGITSENRRLRNSAEYSRWRKKIFDRDGYKCVNCGLGGKLVADHIKSWCLYPSLRFDIDNGRTMCEYCHRETENYGYRAYMELKENEVGGSIQYMLI